MEDKLAKEEEQLNAADIDGTQALKASDDRTRLVRDCPFVASDCQLTTSCSTHMQELERMKSRLSDLESEKIAIERKFASLKDEVSGRCTLSNAYRLSLRLLDITARA